MTKSRSDLTIRARILLAGIGARRGSAAMLFLVAVIAIAAAAIGPMFLQSADTSVLSSTERAAPFGQPDLLASSNGGEVQFQKLSAAAKLAESDAHGLLFPAQFAVDVGGHFMFKHQNYESDVVTVTDICSHLRFVEGACPTGANDVAVSNRSAALAHITIGSKLPVGEPHSTAPIVMTVTGIYVPPPTLNTAYWKSENYFIYGSGTASNIILDPLIATFATALENPEAIPSITADMAWRPSAALSGAPTIRSTANTITSQLLKRDGVDVSTGIGTVLNASGHDDSLMSAVVLAIVLQLILLSLLILYSLGKSAIEARRQESEFARRHGFPRSAMISLAIGEPATLIVAAFPVGLLVAWGTLAVFTRTLFVAGTPVSFPVIALASSAGVCVAGVIAMALASSDLWRSRSATGRQARRSNVVVDAFAVALAVGGLLLLLTKGSLSASRADSLSLLAPGMLTLGVALIGLRVATLVVRLIIARTGESSRVAWFLALRQIGRRPTTLRRLLPLTVATAVLLFAVSSFFLASSNRSLIANFDVGAAKVVDVTPPPSLNFEAAVRRADPSGREAMAAAYYTSATGEMLAVDSSRLSSVAFWPQSLSGESLTALAHKLSPQVPNGVSFTGTALRLTIDVQKGTPSIELGIDLFDQTYQASPSLYIGPIAAGLHSYTFSLTGCTEVCRLIGLAPNWESSATNYSGNVRFALDGVAVQHNGTWKSVGFGAGHSATWSVQPSSIQLEPSPSAVVFEIPGEQLALQGLLLSPVDLPEALPAVVTGAALSADAPPSPSPQGNIDVDLGGGLVTAHPAVVVPTLPFIGSNGVLVDLNLAERAATSSEDYRAFQVWLAPSASPKILSRLRADGVVIGTTTSAAARLGVLDHDGIALAYAVALIVSPIAALLAIGTVGFVIISDGRRRRREMASLWMAGIPMRVVRRAQLLENALVLGTALLLGAVIGFVTDSLSLSSLPQFAQGTGGLAISRSVPIGPFFAAVGIFAVLLVLAVEISTRLVAGGRRSQTRNDGGSIE